MNLSFNVILFFAAVTTYIFEIANGDVKTNLNYHVDDGIRPKFYGYQREGIVLEEGVPDLVGKTMAKEVTIINGRQHQLSLDANSFELTNCETSLTTAEFYEEGAEKITNTYYKEMAECVKQKLGAAHVLVFHHQVRNKERNNGKANDIVTSVQGYANGVHSDTHPDSAEESYSFVSIGVDSDLRQGRYLYMNLWRNIDDERPVSANPLAVLDQTSVTDGVGSEDYLESDLYTKDPNTGFIYGLKQYRLNQKNSDNHKWYYFPNMTKSEAILFKQWDSDPKRQTNLCFHTAFEDPTTPKNAPTRQSIEVRMIVYFPDHVPNTCPSQAKVMYYFLAIMLSFFTSIYPISTSVAGIGSAALIAYLLNRCCRKRSDQQHEKNQ